MTTLDEKVRDIIDFSDYEDLPDEQRALVKKYMREQKINDYWTIITKYDKYIPQVFKKVLITALTVMVSSYQKDYK